MSTAFPHPAVVSFGVGRQRQYQFMTAPTDNTLPTYQHYYSYDSLDRITSGEKGTVSYSDSNHVHAATTLGSLSNPYASYDAMGNMTCRNIDTTSAHTCGSNPTGASMTYDAEGRMDSWTAPSGTTASDKFLYDNEGNRVLQRTSTTTGGTTTVTDDITFDGYTEVTISGGTTATSKYYNANGQRVAMRVNGILSYLISDILGSSTVALNSDGSGQAVQLFSSYGSVRYSWGSMPTTYNFTGQRLDSLTGLLYYNFRYYDPVSGRFTRADTVDTNAGGLDPYAYVGDNPETKTDPTGHDDTPSNDPYLKYVYAWYSFIHPLDTVDMNHEISNAALPRGMDYRRWLSIADYGTTRSGYADIVNVSTQVVWEVKTGGGQDPYTVQPNGVATGMGSDWPSEVPNSTVDKGVQQAKWYATRLNTRQGNYVENQSYEVGNRTTNDPIVGAILYLCGGTCEVDYSDGTRLFITNPRDGILSYKLDPTHQPTTEQNPSVVSIKSSRGVDVTAIIMSMQIGQGVGQLLPGLSGGFSGLGQRSGTPATDPYYLSWGYGTGGNCSFTADTLVSTPRGFQIIGNLVVGDQVIAYDPISHELESQSIIHVWAHRDSDLIDVVIIPLPFPLSKTQGNEEEIVHTTSEHPFLTEEGFIPAGQLHLGMRLLGENGRIGVVEAIREGTGTMVMLNLEVANVHTFAVGEGRWIVHNKCML